MRTMGPEDVEVMLFECRVPFGVAQEDLISVERSDIADVLCQCPPERIRDRRDHQAQDWCVAGLQLAGGGARRITELDNRLRHPFARLRPHLIESPIEHIRHRAGRDPSQACNVMNRDGFLFPQLNCLAFLTECGMEII